MFCQSFKKQPEISFNWRSVCKSTFSDPSHSRKHDKRHIVWSKSRISKAFITIRVVVRVLPIFTTTSKNKLKPAMVAHTCNPSTGEAEAGELWVQDQLRLRSETLSQKQKKKKRKKRIGLQCVLCGKFHEENSWFNLYDL
jgi:hypothetical protein